MDVGGGEGCTVGCFSVRVLYRHRDEGYLESVKRRGLRRLERDIVVHLRCGPKTALLGAHRGR